MAKGKKIILELEYPCPWVYKVIGMDEGAMRAAVAEIMGDCPHEVQASRRSETGKYCSLAVSLTVESPAHRIGLYEALKAHKAVKLVL
jgi:putative lipoic acid-binding regulatory protein